MKERELQKLPACDICGHPIQQDHFFYINGEKICVSCLNEYFRKETDDYASE